MSLDQIPAIATAVGGAGVALLTAWNTRQGKRIKALEESVNGLTRWKTVALTHIGELRFSLAEHGITPPDPPEELGLTSAASAGGRDEQKGG